MLSIVFVFLCAASGEIKMFIVLRFCKICNRFIEMVFAIMYNVCTLQHPHSLTNAAKREVNVGQEIGPFRPEIWPRTVTIDAPGFTLAWHSWASQLQTLSTDTSMSPREGSSIPVGLLHTSIPSCCTTAPAFSRSSPVGGSATSAQHVRPSGIRCRSPDDLQRSARWAARPHRQHDNFQTTFKDIFSRAIYTSSALEAVSYTHLTLPTIYSV